MGPEVTLIGSPTLEEFLVPRNPPGWRKEAPGSAQALGFPLMDPIGEPDLTRPFSCLGAWVMAWEVVWEVSWVVPPNSRGGAQVG